MSEAYGVMRCEEEEDAEEELREPDSIDLAGKLNAVLMQHFTVWRQEGMHQ